jgi:hypothetical protein
MSGWFGYMGRKVIDKVFGATDFTPPAVVDESPVEVAAAIRRFVDGAAGAA